jgi:hypothetical protein
MKIQIQASRFFLSVTLLVLTSFPPGAGGPNLMLEVFCSSDSAVLCVECSA